MDAAQLQRHPGEIVGVRGDEGRCCVADQAFQGVAGHRDGLTHQPLEPVLVFAFKHQGVHHILGGLVDAHEQTALLPRHEDRLAVHTQEAAPVRRERRRDLKGCERCAAELIDPCVERDTRDRPPHATLQERGQRPIRRQALNVQTHGLEDDVLGEPRSGPDAAPTHREALTAAMAQEPLQRLELIAQTLRSRARPAVTLGLQAPAVGGIEHVVYPSQASLSGRLPDSYHENLL